jgi:hypothetical protein
MKNIGLIFLFSCCFSCGVKKAEYVTIKGEKPYKLTRKDRKILAEIKREDSLADVIQKERLKDPDYLEYIKKTNAESKPVKQN